MNFYNFKPMALSPVEYCYNADCTLSHYYFLLERKDYPMCMYAKIDLDGKTIKEVYPVYLCSAKNSIEVITRNISYLGNYDMNHYAYLSWNMKDEPNEIYLPKKNCIERYTDDKMTAKYYTIFDVDSIQESSIFTENQKELIKKEKPDVVMYSTNMKDEFKKFDLLFNFGNDSYLDKRKNILALQEKWS